MTAQEIREKNIERLINISKDTTVLPPPCCNNNISEIFEKFLSLPNYNRLDQFINAISKQYSIFERKKIRKKIVALVDYFQEVESYLDNVCASFAGIYQSHHFGGRSMNYGDDQEYFEISIKACLTRYPWLDFEWVKNYLDRVCWLCNR
ncbi:MAG: hypothetical protein K2G88_08455 [Oscillospiraceae bacterium]|nr:hypothetical protein [Oscillospiraceae bacterium]